MSSINVDSQREGSAVSDLAMTDDEVLAMLHFVGRPQRLFLPTVAVDNPDEISHATMRGFRSLAARGLLDGQSLTDPLAAWADRMHPASPRVLTYIGNSELTMVGFTLFHQWWPTDDGWLRHATSPLGAHRMEFMSVADVSDLLEESFEQIQRSSTPVLEGQPLYLCLAVATEGESRAVGVNSESVLTATGGRSGRSLTSLDTDDGLAAHVRGLLDWAHKLHRGT